MGWKYAPLKVVDEYGERWSVCEVYSDIGHTMGVSPAGETKEELLKDLHTMLYDVESEDVVVVIEETRTGALPT